MPAERVSLTKQQRLSEAGAELLALCQSVTEDGRLSKEEILEIAQWLRRNRGSELPAVEFLEATVSRIVADKRVTKEEQAELYRAIEKILPPEVRKDAVDARREVERGRREKERAERQAERDQQRKPRQADRERNAIVARANFMVAGVRHEGRPEIIEAYVDEGVRAFLIRDRSNKYSQHAIEVRVENGCQIGYVPEDHAMELAPLLDKGCKHDAYVTKVLTAGRSPIPVVQAFLLPPDAEGTLAVAEQDVPSRPGPASRDPSDAAKPRSGCAILVLAVASLSASLVVLVSRSQFWLTM